MQAKEKFWDRIKTEDTHWLWLGGTQNGYGYLWNGNKRVYAHRYSYELHKGEIPEGLQIDHLCKVRNCVNPYHLEAVTSQENMRRSNAGLYNRLKTHCNEGHVLTGKSRNGKRYCIDCSRSKHREYYKAKRLKETQNGV